MTEVVSKREHTDSDSDHSDGWIGPTPAEAAPPKKRKGR